MAAPSMVTCRCGHRCQATEVALSGRPQTHAPPLSAFPSLLRRRFLGPDGPWGNLKAPGGGATRPESQSAGVAMPLAVLSLSNLSDFVLWEMGKNIAISKGYCKK